MMITSTVEKCNRPLFSALMLKKKEVEGIAWNWNGRVGGQEDQKSLEQE